MDPELKIDCERVYLRRLKLKDASDIYTQINDPEVVRWTTRIPHPYPEGGAEKFIRQSHYRWRKGTDYIFGIIHKSSGRLIGVISLGNVFPRHGCAELGFWLGRESWNRGYMTEAARAVTRFAVHELGLYRIYASSFEANTAAGKVLENCGFKLEGVMREAVVREGKRQNFLNYGLLKSELPG